MTMTRDDNDNDDNIDNVASGSGSVSVDTSTSGGVNNVPDETVFENNESQPPRLMVATTSENLTQSAAPASNVVNAPATLKCRAFPHGLHSIVISFISTFAWLICFSQDDCDYARVTGPSVAEITGSTSTPFIDIGFSHYRAPILKNGEWILDMTTPCVQYTTNIGATVQFAKICSFLASVLGGASAFFIWFSLCLVIDKSRWRWVAMELLAASVLQALSFTSFASSLCKTNTCNMYVGARANLLTCIIWALSALFLFRCVPSARMKSRIDQQLPSQDDLSSTNANETGIQSGRTAPTVSEII